MRATPRVISFWFVVLVHLCAAVQAREVWLDDLNIMAFSEGIRPVQAKQSYAKGPLRMQGTTYARGLGAQTPAVLPFAVNGEAERFTAVVGADDSGNRDLPISFFVLGDGKVLFASGEMRVGDAPQRVDVDLTGVQLLGLLVTDPVGGANNKRTYCNWADARLVMRGDALPQQQPNAGERIRLTPPAPAEPRITSARVFGATPGRPFLYNITATGQRPLRFAAEGLPAGLSVDPETGFIRGRVAERGTYRVRLTATNPVGTAQRDVRIEIGDTIALTPPLGWNAWNAWERHVDREKVLASARAMVSTGLRDYGWSYINIDDTWQGVRGGPLNALQPNEKFPRFAEMVAEIHALGLKAGLYSTPYIQSYAGYVGASSNFPNGGETREEMAHRAEFRTVGPHRFEPNDARQMAEWGIDFLKYDWRIDLASAERMAHALRESGRDVVFSLSNNAPFDKAQEWARVSNLYRTGPDIRDSWTSLYLTTFELERWAPFSGPGHWMDPDMMIVGEVDIHAGLHPTRLTPDEQYSHVSMLCLLSAPMLLGCPLEKLDAFTTGLLTNSELIDINQDPLGKPARRVVTRAGVQVWSKPLEDGSHAVGLFNTGGFGETPQSYFRWGTEPAVEFSLRLSELGLGGAWAVRDAWRQRDRGVVDQAVSVTIPHHGVVVLRLTRK